MVRLATDLWIAAYRARLDAAGIYCHVIARGDATAGAVLVKLATMDGRASLWARAYGTNFKLVWEQTAPTGPESEVDAEISRRRRDDRDLWVLEIEDRQGRHLLDEMDGLEP
ncbi:MAG: DUF1491 family protein [Pseudomonadota bacterium]